MPTPLPPPPGSVLAVRLAFSLPGVCDDIDQAALQARLATFVSVDTSKVRMQCIALRRRRLDATAASPSASVRIDVVIEMESAADAAAAATSLATAMDSAANASAFLGVTVVAVTAAPAVETVQQPAPLPPTPPPMSPPPPSLPRPSPPPPSPSFPPVPTQVADALALVLGRVANGTADGDGEEGGDATLSAAEQANQGMVELTAALEDQMVPPVVAMAVVEAVSEAVAAAANASGAQQPGQAGGSQEATDGVADVVVAAAGLVDAVITAAETVDEGTAIATTSVLSVLVGQLKGQSLTANASNATTTTTTTTTNAQVAAGLLQSAVGTLTRRVADALPEGAPSVELRSENINISLAARAPASLSATPITVDTASSFARVELPTGLLGMLGPAAASGADADAGAGGGGGGGAVACVLTVTSVNLHGGAAAGVAMVGPTVSFSLRRGGSELDVSDLPSTINLTLPVDAPPNATETCVGMPGAADVLTTLDSLVDTGGGGGGGEGGGLTSLTRREADAIRDELLGLGCRNAQECRYWVDAPGGGGGGEWRNDSCVTVVSPDGGGVLCKCDHLTDFIVVQVPSSWGDVADSILRAQHGQSGRLGGVMAGHRRPL